MHQKMPLADRGASCRLPDSLAMLQWTLEDRECRMWWNFYAPPPRYCSFGRSQNAVSVFRGIRSSGFPFMLWFSVSVWRIFMLLLFIDLTNVNHSLANRAAALMR